MTAAVIGGGIGGMAAAISLLRAGVDVQVYEQAPEQKEVGAGIQIPPDELARQPTTERPHQDEYAAKKRAPEVAGSGAE
jgi:flavin-dependent dehydrogenase